MTLDPLDVDGFFAAPGSLDPEAYIELEYTFECVGSPRRSAAALCMEQSTAQWARAGVNEDLRPRFAAKVIDIESRPITEFSVGVAGTADEGPRVAMGARDASGARGAVEARGGMHACRALIAHPHANFGPRLPNLLSAVLGEGVFHVPGVPVVRLEDIRFPASFLAAFAGPRFGLAGLRERLDAHGRPLFIGVIKPNLGLAPEAFAALGNAGLVGGLDIVKDDEMLADAAWSPLAVRARLLGEARARAERETGAPKAYLANITDEVDRITALHDEAVGAGAGAVMLNALPVGLSAVRMLARHATVPLFAHFPMLAAFTQVPGFGAHPRVFTKLQRLAGCDAVIFPGFGERMRTAEAEVLAQVRACLEPMGSLKAALPVPGGSDSAATLAGVRERIGHADFGFVVGRGVFGHPGGPAAGARALRAAWASLRHAAT